MSDAENDPVIRRAVEELRRLPEVDPAALRRVIEASAMARVSPVDEPVIIAGQSSGRRGLWSIIGLAAAAGLVGFFARGQLMTSTATPRPSVAAGAAPTAPARTTASGAGVVSGPAPGVSIQNASAGDPSLAPIQEQFVIENSGAHRISVVGDFNQWKPGATPMTRSSEGHLWSAVVPLTPGRHIYGFMIDDSLFVLDPRAPKSRDPDLGTEGSVKMVGRQ